jgi:PHD/YefM family antitoxin component YafN of YafNO toxin-antitoxin module
MKTVNYNVVILSSEAYDSITETNYLTSSPAMMKRLQDAKNQIKESKGIKINIADL